MIIEGIFIMLGIVLAIGGLCEIIHAIKLVTIMNPKQNPILCVVLLKPKVAVSQLRFASEQQNWLGEDYAKYVVALTDNIDSEELDDCKLLADDRRIILCSTEQLSRVVKNIV